MARSSLPLPLRSFIQEHIHSINELETLLFLFEKRPAFWRIGDVSRQLRTSEESTARVIEGLLTKGFLVEETEAGGARRFAFRPAIAETSDLVRDLAEAFKIYRIRIIETIFAQPDEPLRAFVDAFKLRKDDPKGDGDG